MAAANPNGSPEKNIDAHPKTPTLVKKNVATSPLPPDTEEHVVEQTEGVFRNFAFQMYTRERSACDEEDGGESTPAIPELTNFTTDPLGPASQVGRQLAQIGDDINRRYENQFVELVQMLNVSPDFAYESFAGVVRKVFHDGQITWGRVVTLLSFAYRMAVSVLQRGVSGFLSKIVKYLCKFIYMEKIAKWIAEQGGWVAALQYVPETLGWPVFGMLVVLAAVSVGASIFLARR